MYRYTFDVCTWTAAGLGWCKLLSVWARANIQRASIYVASFQSRRSPVAAVKRAAITGNRISLVFDFVVHRELWVFMKLSLSPSLSPSVLSILHRTPPSVRGYFAKLGDRFASAKVKRRRCPLEYLFQFLEWDAGDSVLKRDLNVDPPSRISNTSFS